MKPRNILLALQGQLPWSRFFRNFFVTGSGWRLFSVDSHRSRRTGSPKATYGSLAAARRSAASLRRRYGGRVTAYKCLFCDGYHIGRSRR